jgi:deoxycitidine kinase/deoxyguanosine kinase
MKIISIEGNIGSGKSTFVEALKKHFHSESICFLDEPVELWNTIVDEHGKTMLENYYQDSKKYAFSFQMMAYISRLSILKKAIDSKKYDIIITERSLYTDKHVFCQMLYDDHTIQEMDYKIYNKWFDEFNMNVPIHYVYLKTDPQVSYDRVIQRNRHGEIIPLSYLERCSLYHDIWLCNKDIITIDANVDTSHTKEWVQIIEQMISS